jgi:hypothetical protein
MSFLAAMLLAATPSRLPPVDQCGGGAGFAGFRRQIESAVSRRDLEAMTSLMAPDVQLSFGGAVGFSKFRDHDRSGPGGDGMWQELWAEMAKVLRLGCGTARDGSGKEYRAWPAMFVTGGDLDGYDTWVALPGAILRRRPTESAPVVQRLPPWTVLREVREATVPYTEVRTPKGRSGFIAKGQMRSLIDYRLVAEQREGRWMITAFVAGD